MEPQMTNKETAAHLRAWCAEPVRSHWSWPTDACGYDQHIRFVEYRNREWGAASFYMSFDQFVLTYANQLEQQPDQT